MANWYVRSGAAGVANGADWADAYLTIQAGLAATNTAPGDIIWVSEDHSELTGAGNLTFQTANATALAPLYVLCANHNSLTTPPNTSVDLQTTANVTCNTTIVVANGFIYWHGINFNGISGNTIATTSINLNSGFGFGYFSNCSFNVLGTAATAFLAQGSSASAAKSIFNNCTFTFGGINQHMAVGSPAEYINCSFAPSGSIPVNLFYFSTGFGAGTTWKMKRCNFNNIPGIFNALNATVGSWVVAIEDSIINATANLSVNTTTASSFTFLRCRTPYSEDILQYYGTMKDSNTVFRVGGGSDPIGPKSKAITTPANTTAFFPFTPASSFVRYNNALGSPIQAKIYGTWNGAAPPTSAQVWLEVDYFANATSTQTQMVSSGSGPQANSGVYLPNMATVSGVNDTTSTWTGGGSNNFVISVTFTPQIAGFIRGVVRVGQGSLAAANLFLDSVMYLTDVSNNLLFTSPLAYDVPGAIINQNGSIGGSSIIIQGL